MIVADTSALVAIYRQEPEGREIYDLFGRSTDRVVPPFCIVEFTLLRRLGGDRRTWVKEFLKTQEASVPDFTPDMAEVAADAAERYGRGSGHPARLNFGDCLSYAVARHLDAPLLYKGGDFALTDIESALAP